MLLYLYEIVKLYEQTFDPAERKLLLISATGFAGNWDGEMGDQSSKNGIEAIPYSPSPSVWLGMESIKQQENGLKTLPVLAFRF